MSIAVLMLTVVTRTETIAAKYPGGLKAYLQMPYVWHDAYLVGTSFMNVLDADNHLQHLSKQGIVFDGSSQSAETALVDQVRGILTPCDWLHFTRAAHGQSICWLAGTEPGEPVLPVELAAEYE